MPFDREAAGVRLDLACAPAAALRLAVSRGRRSPAQSPRSRSRRRSCRRLASTGGLVGHAAAVHLATSLKSAPSGAIAITVLTPAASYRLAGTFEAGPGDERIGIAIAQKHDEVRPFRRHQAGRVGVGIA